MRVERRLKAGTKQEVDSQLAVMRDGAVEIYGEDDLRPRLAAAIREGRPLRVKLGLDPSSPQAELTSVLLENDQELMKRMRLLSEVVRDKRERTPHSSASDGIHPLRVIIDNLPLLAFEEALVGDLVHLGEQAGGLVPTLVLEDGDAVLVAGQQITERVADQPAPLGQVGHPGPGLGPTDRTSQIELGELEVVHRCRHDRCPFRCCLTS